VSCYCEPRRSGALIALHAVKYAYTISIADGRLRSMENVRHVLARHRLEPAMATKQLPHVEGHARDEDVRALTLSFLRVSAQKSTVTESGVRLPDRQTRPWSHTERTKSSKRDSQGSVRCRGVSLGRTPLHRFQGPTVGLRFPSNGASPARCAPPASTAAPSGAPRSACAPRGLAPAAMPAVQPDRNAR